jgi:hypothetical protein
MFMPKKGISVTLHEANLLWLKSRTVARKGRSLSETLDDLVTAARTSAAPAGITRSVVGTVDIADIDPELDQADAYLQGLVSASISRPFLARETPPDRTRAPRGRRRG